MPAAGEQEVSSVTQYLFSSLRPRLCSGNLEFLLHRQFSEGAEGAPLFSEKIFGRRTEAGPDLSRFAEGALIFRCKILVWLSSGHSEYPILNRWLL